MRWSYSWTKFIIITVFRNFGLKNLFVYDLLFTKEPKKSITKFQKLFLNFSLPAYSYLVHCYSHSVLFFNLLNDQCIEKSKIVYNDLSSFLTSQSGFASFLRLTFFINAIWTEFLFSKGCIRDTSTWNGPFLTPVGGIRPTKTQILKKTFSWNAIYL